MITALRRCIAGLFGGLLSILTLRLLPVNKSGHQVLSDPHRDDDRAGEPADAPTPATTMAPPRT
ncbi:MAG: hypothetical protein IT383_15965 [Deltaproteobacteria bacterium]|nr:hypothetical protein [Deltaproteobacteria bacterium]